MGELKAKIYYLLMGTIFGIGVWNKWLNIFCQLDHYQFFLPPPYTSFEINFCVLCDVLYMLEEQEVKTVVVDINADHSF